MNRREFFASVLAVPVAMTTIAASPQKTNVIVEKSKQDPIYYADGNWMAMKLRQHAEMAGLSFRHQKEQSAIRILS